MSMIWRLVLGVYRSVQCHSCDLVLFSLVVFVSYVNSRLELEPKGEQTTFLALDDKILLCEMFLKKRFVILKMSFIQGSQELILKFIHCQK